MPVIGDEDRAIVFLSESIYRAAIRVGIERRDNGIYVGEAAFNNNIAFPNQATADLAVERATAALKQNKKVVFARTNATNYSVDQSNY